MAESPIPLRSKPGVQRDGTDFDRDSYQAALWCRFQRGLPRKIGGYLSSAQTLPQVSRGLRSFTQDNVNYIHSGSSGRITQLLINSSGTVGGQHDRTPAGMADDANRLWNFDTFTDAVGGVGVLIAHGPGNLNDISSSVNYPLYQGDQTVSTILTEVTGTNAPAVSGGIVAVPPYVFAFGNNGFVTRNHDPNDLTAWEAGAWITGQKIVAGWTLRSGGQIGPAALFWSLDSLIQAVFDSDPSVVFDYNTITSQISIMGQKTIVEYDGIQYWCGVDRFLMFNGVVREVPNNMNLNFFFDNVNYAARNKCFAFTVPRFGEIWWCFPMGNATECNHAVIYNVRENTWYDTSLPGSGRTAGLFASVYEKPFMTDFELTDDGYTLWQHETGQDQVIGAQSLAVKSNFTTSEFSFLTNQSPVNKAMTVARIEPDFVQTGDMTVQVSGRANARSPSIPGEIKTFPAVATTPEEQVLDFREERRLLSFTFESNVAGGNYEMGQVLAHVGPGSSRVTQ